VEWSQQIYLTAGLGALALGGGVLIREPRRRRNRYFALLCGALAVWTLGEFASRFYIELELPLHRVFLAGSCAAAPLGLHFSLVVARDTGPLRRRVLPLAYAGGALLYLLSWTRLYDTRPLWNGTAIAVLGGILAIALVVLGRSWRGVADGPERRALRLVFWAGVVAVAGGLSDFIPRAVLPWPNIGPASVLLFLVIVCSVIVRHRFMDVDAFLIRAVILVAGAAAGALVIFGTMKLTRPTYFPMFLATLVVLVGATAFGRFVMSGAHQLVTPQDPVAKALLDISRTLPDAVDSDGIWRAIERGREALPGDVNVEVFLREADAGEYRVGFRTRGVEEDSPPVAEGSALPRMLLGERLPLSRTFLERETQEAHGDVRWLAVEALEQLVGTEARLVVPLLDGEVLVGWLSVRGGFPDRYQTAEVAAAFMAVGNQAVASLGRIEALEQARRRETLAAVGEMAAGLAHEVRNPVAAIRGAGQAISPDATPDQAREMLEVIDEETERLGRVVGEFLDYARPDSPRREPVPLDRVARQTLRAAEVAGRGMSAEVESAPDAPAALGDPDQVRRVFENLIRNAWEAAGADGTLRIEISGEPGGRVRARFEDNGPGIPDDEVAWLFQPFRTKRQGGTGLGLALVHRIVESHGGEIRVDGRPGRGAVFTVTLPAAKGTF
jgi:signal transduction histidine kinase